MPRVDIWMPIYIGDYLRDTEELSAAEHGSYLLLLMHYWMKNGEIGSDIDRLTRVARTCEETCRFILGSYFEFVDGNYKNKRADIEMRNAENRRVASRENGHKGGRPTKNNLQETGGLSVGIPSGNLDYNLQKSSSPSHKEREEKKENIKSVASATAPKEALFLAALLFELHRDSIDSGYKVPPAHLETWARDIDRLHRIDGREWKDIEATIRWVKTPGQWWAPNIMSGAKLRDKYPTIIGQMNRPIGQPLKVQSRTEVLEMAE